MARDGHGTEIRPGDEVSVLSPAVMEGHNGVGIASRIGRRLLTVTDAQGREARVRASDVNVDWQACE